MREQGPDNAMLHAPSALSLAASALYAIVMVACALTLRDAARRGDRGWRAWVWAGLCLLFLLLAASRITGAEEWLRDTLRTSLRAQGQYGDRREIQRLVAAALVAIGAAVSAVWFYRTVRNRRSRRGLAVMVALAGAGSLIVLVTLRLLSFHPIDRLLYGLKLNWVIDLGASLAVLGAAAYCLRRPRPPRQTPRQPLR